MEIKGHFELSLDDMRFISKHSKGHYSVLSLENLKYSNVFFFDKDLGFIRAEEPQRNSNFLIVHGVFWGKGVFRHFSVFRQIEDYLKKMYFVDYILCEIPLVSQGLHRLLTKIGFNVDFRWQRFADEGNLMYSKYVGGK